MMYVFTISEGGGKRKRANRHMLSGRCFVFSLSSFDATPFFFLFSGFWFWSPTCTFTHIHTRAAKHRPRHVHAFPFSLSRPVSPRCCFSTCCVCVSCRECSSGPPFHLSTSSPDSFPLELFLSLPFLIRLNVFYPIGHAHANIHI